MDTVSNTRHLAERHIHRDDWVVVLAAVAWIASSLLYARVALAAPVVAPQWHAGAQVQADPACDPVSPQPQPPGDPLQILVIGDSISAGSEADPCAWQHAFSGRLMLAGVPHVITTFAVGGSRCDYWPSRMDSVLSQVTPDLAYLYCGTNDDPSEQCYGEPCTDWAFRSIVESVRAARTPEPLIVPTLIGYSDATMAPGWLLQNEPQTNDHLWSQMLRYMPPAAPVSWWAGIADVQVMPGTATYLDGDDCDPAVATCAVHPNLRGFDTIGRIMYDAARVTMGWPDPATWGEPVLCGMSGHRVGGRRPAYTPC